MPIDRRELLGGTAKLATLAGLTGVAAVRPATLAGQSLLTPTPAAADTKDDEKVRQKIGAGARSSSTITTCSSAAAKAAKSVSSVCRPCVR